MMITYITLENLKEILASHLDNAIAETIMAECREQAGSQIRKSEGTKQYNRLYHEVSALLAGRLRDAREEFNRQLTDLRTAFARAVKVKRIEQRRKFAELTAQRARAIASLDRTGDEVDFLRALHETKGIFAARRAELLKETGEEMNKFHESFADDLEGVTLYYERLIQNLTALQAHLRGAELEDLAYMSEMLKRPGDSFRKWVFRYATIVNDTRYTDLEPEDIESDADDTPSDSDAEA
ncbi:MAG: hypothetical protein HDR95_04595 [Bacteroides sp.]|nr:hypothetical protein [Bacteroides sp.]